MTDRGLSSELRLFLSVDVAGSTALKHRVNYHDFFKKFRVAEELLRDCNAPDPAEHFKKVLSKLSEGDVDWGVVLAQCFDSFSASFVELIQQLQQDDRYPWKAVGDELVYSFKVTSRGQVQRLLECFLGTLRKEDRWWNDKATGIRLKGTAWLAGFPIQNKRIAVALTGPGGGRIDLDDYLGPDMDVGFRLGKESFAGMCVASLNLVALLGAKDDGKYQVRFAHVGWATLHGVWGQRPYPIFWTEFAEESEYVSLGQPVISAWAPGQSDRIEKWLTDKKQQAKLFTRNGGLIDDLVKQLAPEYGIVLPYIPGSDPVPELHQRMLTFLGQLQEAERQRESVQGERLGEDEGTLESGATLGELRYRVAKMRRRPHEHDPE
jgi:hypothetical protein